MKTSLVSIALVCAGLVAQAQQSKYETTMSRQLMVLDTAMHRNTFTTLFNAFERIHRVERSKWEPAYYMAYCASKLSFWERDPSKIDATADRAEILINQADSLNAPVAETLCLRAMLTFTRINVDFMERGPKYLPLVNALLLQALKKDPGNPRASFLLATSKLSAPEQFGGNKKAGYDLLKQARELYGKTEATALMPRWGKINTEKMLASYEKELNSH